MNEPGSAERKLGWVSIAFAVVNGLALIFTTVGMLQVREKFAAIYGDLGVQLPTLTQFVLSVPPTGVACAALLLLALLAAKEFLRPRVVPLAINLAWLVAGAVVVGLFTLALFRPLVSVVGALSAPQ